MSEKEKDKTGDASQSGTEETKDGKVNVEINKPDASLKLGITIEPSSDPLRGHFVSAVSDTLSAISVGDVIFSVNGKSSFDDIVEEFKNNVALSIKMKKAVEIQIDRPDASQNFGLTLTSKHAEELGLEVTAVDVDGGVHRWNQGHPLSAVRVRDVVYSINGKTTFQEVVQELEKSTSISIRAVRDEEVGELHTGLTAYTPDPQPFHWTTWSGAYEAPEHKLFGSNVYEPYANNHVFAVIDRVRGGIFIAYTLLQVIGYYAKVIAVDRGFGSLGGGAEASASWKNNPGGNVLALFSEVVMYTQVLSLLGMAFATRNQKATLVYVAAERLLSWWHKGNPPFFPQDRRAMACNNFQMAGFFFIQTFAIWAVQEAFKGTLSDMDVRTMSTWPAMLSGMYSFFTGALHL